MLKVGLTGGIASGKSSVGEMFVELGAHLLQADGIAHELMEPGQKVYDEVVAHFGREILNSDGTVNRARLAQAAFGPSQVSAPASALGTSAAQPAVSQNPESRIEELNRIVHPTVIRRHDEWLETMSRKDPQGIAIVEAALLLEAGAASHFDRLIVVTCNKEEEQRAARFAIRQKIPIDEARKEVARRMAAQLPEKEKAKAADYVIDNSGSLDETRAQVGQVWEKLQKTKV